MKLPTVADVLARRLRGKAAVVGIGNRGCADDGAGLSVVEKLVASPSLKAIDAGDAPELSLDRITEDSPDVVVFVDAADLGADPGSVAVIETEQLNSGWGNGHQPPLSAMMTYVARSCGADTFLLGIQPEDLGPGHSMSRSVSRTVAILAGILNGIAVQEENSCEVETL